MKMAKVIELQPRTVSGNSGDLRASGGNSVRAQLNVTAASGTAPTLTVILEDTLDGGINYNTIGTFAQKTAAGREVISITAPFSETLRVSWTIAGTNPSFTFSVDWFLATRREN
jgi:hypothetical protein